VKLSTKGRYGVTAMYDLALQFGNGYTPLNSIAQRQMISEPYLEQLIAPLRKAGLVRSVRGPHGGYILAKLPSEITIGDIIRILEGPIAPVECVEDDNEFCGKMESCITRDIWVQLRDSMEKVLDSITLADLVKSPKGINIA